MSVSINKTTVTQMIAKADASGAAADLATAEELATLLQGGALDPDAKALALRFMQKYGVAPLADSSAPTMMTEADAIEIVMAHYGNKMFGRADLQQVLDDPAASPALKAAVKYILDHFSEYDDAAGNVGHEDGIIALCDLQTAYAYTNMDPVGAIDVLRSNFDLLDTIRPSIKDGKFGIDDLQAALSDPNSSPELKAACRYLIAHPEVFNTIDRAAFGWTDGMITTWDLDVARSAYGLNDVTAIQGLMGDFDRFDSENKPLRAFGIGLQGKFDKGNIQDVLKSNESTNQQKAEAMFLLDHPDVLQQITGPDGTITRESISAYLRSHPTGTVSYYVPANHQDNILAATPMSYGTDSQSPAGAPPSPASPKPDPYGDAFQNQIEYVLTDPTLTIEDQVAFFLMILCKEMDKEIQDQMIHISELQKAQNNKPSQANTQSNSGQGNTSQGNTSQGNTSQGTDNSNSSIDVETLKLKRLIDKRTQLFDTCRQIIDKYNQTAKGIIDTISR